MAWIGRPGASPYEEQVETYRRRTARRWPAEDVAVRPAAGRDGDPARALALEAAALERHCADGWTVWALDEAGRQLTSVALAEALGALAEAASPGVCFLIGGDLGLDRTLRTKAERVLSLGRLTLPHQLARLVLWEQLFRATHILGGGGYHREGTVQ